MKTTHGDGPGSFDDLFDLDGDGRTDAAEAAFMFTMFDERQEEEDRQKQLQNSKICDLDDLDIEGM